MEKDTFFIKRIRELADISYQRDIVTFTDFLNLNEQNLVTMERFPGITVEFYGGYDHAERVMAAFHPASVQYEWEYPLSCLKIEARSRKFSEDLTHRDYLGAILNLGVDRSVTGDILVKDHTAWLFCHERIAGFLAENLLRVRHTEVTAEVSAGDMDIPEPELVPVTGTCSSVRLDSLIALAFQASRSSMVSYIEGGLVFVNGKLITSNGYEPKEGDIISVRGKGRFIFDGALGKTKKGRISVRLLRYQ